MYLTLEILKQKKARAKDIQYIALKYPKGAELSEIILDKNAPLDFLHWGKEYLNYNKQEFQLYLQRINIQNSNSCYYSQNVFDSSFISRSDTITNSSRIFSSNNIECSQDVVGSEQVNDSQQIFESSMVVLSKQVNNSININDSKNIVDSSFVFNSKNIFCSSNIFDCCDLRNCKDMTNCYFCASCEGLNNSLFCCRLLEQEGFFIFNTKVNEQRFVLALNQYHKFVDSGLNFVKNWPENFLQEEFVKKEKQIGNFYSSLSTKFYSWVKTLPGFSEQLLNEIISGT